MNANGLDGTNGHDLEAAYMTALQDYLSGKGEGPLLEAYDVGRKAIGRGLGVLHITALHHESLATVLRQIASPEQSALATRSAGVVEAESLSVFEMALRGYREANVQLQRQAEELARSNVQLKRMTEELEQLAQAERTSRVHLEKAHEELKKTQGQLVHAAKLAALGELVGGVAHEINNPLAIVSNNLAILQQESQALANLTSLYQSGDAVLEQHRPELVKEIRELAEQVDLPYLLGHLDDMILRSREALKRIQLIVKNLRHFGRLEERTFELVKDLNTEIASTIAILQGKAHKHNVKLLLEAEPLPPLTCATTKINHVIFSLVDNAIDACEPGGIVTVRTRVAPAGVELHVLDNGRGIPPGIRDHIFNPFFTTKPPGAGTGLGLSISHAYVEEHGGHIAVDSTPGQGSHFTVFLPFR